MVGRAAARPARCRRACSSSSRRWTAATRSTAASSPSRRRRSPSCSATTAPSPRPSCSRASACASATACASAAPRFTLRARAATEPDRAGGAFTLGPRVFLGARRLRAHPPRAASAAASATALLVQLPGNASRPQVDAAATRAARRSRRGAVVAPRDLVAGAAGAAPRPAPRRALPRPGGAAVAARRRHRRGAERARLARQPPRRDRDAQVPRRAAARGVRALPRPVPAARPGRQRCSAASSACVVQRIVPRLLGDLLPAQEIHFWQPGALLRGLAARHRRGLLFACRRSPRVLRVPPLRVLRRERRAAAASRLARAVAGAGVARRHLRARRWRAGRRRSGSRLQLHRRAGARGGAARPRRAAACAPRPCACARLPRPLRAAPRRGAAGAAGGRRAAGARRARPRRAGRARRARWSSATSPPRSTPSCPRARRRPSSSTSSPTSGRASRRCCAARAPPPSTRCRW